jgi:DNA-binding sugar fermentation-stimulating protein
MRLVEEVRDGRFIRRLTRFSGEAFLGQGRVLAHIPHSGRLGELLVRGRRVLRTHVSITHALPVVLTPEKDVVERKE